MPASAWLRHDPSSLPSILRPGEQAAGPQHQHNEESEMARQDLPFRIDMRTNGLRQPKDEAARECTPKASEAADDHGFKGIEQPRWTDRRIEIRPQTKIERRDRDHHEGKAHRQGKDPPD